MNILQPSMQQMMQKQTKYDDMKKVWSKIAPTNPKTKNKVLTGTLAAAILFLIYVGFSNTRISDTTTIAGSSETTPTSKVDAVLQAKSIARGMVLANYQNMNDNDQNDENNDDNAVAHISSGQGLDNINGGCLNDIMNPFVLNTFDNNDNSKFTSNFINSLITDNTQFIGIDRDTINDFLTKYNSQNTNIFYNNNIVRKFRIKEADLNSLRLVFSLTYIRNRYNNIDYEETKMLYIDFVDTNECKIKQIAFG